MQVSHLNDDAHSLCSRIYSLFMIQATARCCHNVHTLCMRDHAAYDCGHKPR